MDMVHHTLAPAEMDKVPHIPAPVEMNMIPHILAPAEMNKVPHILVPAENVGNPYSQTSPAALTQGDGPNPRSCEDA